MISPTTALAACRFAQDASALLLWGAAAYLAWLVPGALSVAVERRLRGWGGAAIALATAVTAAMLPVEAAAVGDGWRDAVDPAVVGAVLVDTGDGYAWIVQAAAASLLVALCLVPPRPRLAGVAAAAGLMLVGLACKGHAALHEGWLGVANRMDYVLHVLSSGAWFGALVPVLVIVPRLAGAGDRAGAVAALRRFSQAGAVAVALALLTGAASTALVLGRWPVDLRSPYEALLDVKVAAVAAMTGLAVVNRYMLVPRLPLSLSALRRATLAEVPLALVALALVAVFGLFDPG